MIAVVGGGWFGCHIAGLLKERGESFILFEASDRLFNGASGHNQNRLHLGFHYPRSASTRKQSREGFQRFIDRYPNLSHYVQQNLYAVCKDKSLIDFDTYQTIMRSDGLEFYGVSPVDVGLQNVSGCIACQERLIDVDAARAYFTELLRDHVWYGAPYNPATVASTVINCTYQAFEPRQWGTNLTYEPCVILVYESASKQAVTLMDGQFYSVYPFKPGAVTLYSVEHSRRGRFNTHAAAARELARTNSSMIAGIRKRIEDGLSHYYPAFADIAKFSDVYTSVRTLPTDASDLRLSSVVREGNVLHVMAGKIDSVFTAGDEVLKCLESS